MSSEGTIRRRVACGLWDRISIRPTSRGRTRRRGNPGCDAGRLSPPTRSSIPREVSAPLSYAGGVSTGGVSKGGPLPGGSTGGVSKGGPLPGGSTGGVSKGGPLPGGSTGGVSKGGPLPGGVDRRRVEGRPVARRRVIAGRRVDHGWRVLAGRRVDHGRRVLAGRRVHHGRRVLAGRRVDHGRRVLAGRRVHHGRRVLAGRRVHHGRRVDRRRVDDGRRVNRRRVDHGGRVDARHLPGAEASSAAKRLWVRPPIRTARQSYAERLAGPRPRASGPGTVPSAPERQQRRREHLAGVVH